jgi:N-dimethylarginine dimethylaminohydrolase
MQFTRAIVRPPSPNFAAGLTSAVEGPPDIGRALEQHAAYVAALRDRGLTVTCLEPVNDAILVAAGYPQMSAALKSRGCRTVPLEMSEFRKMDGGLSCLSLRF